MSVKLTIQSLPLVIAQSFVPLVVSAQDAAPNADIVVTMPAGENTETDTGPSGVGAEGFLISIDGDPVIGDRRVEDIARKADIALSDADVQVKFDGLGAVPRLDLELDDARAFEAGDRVVFQSRLNYPAYVRRGEVRILDLSARGGTRTVQVVPISPNGEAAINLPEGKDLVAVHRVYDARGRFDETEMIPLTVRDDRDFDGDAEQGTDQTARRRIPVTGGAVTVFGSGVRQGATVQTLGETITPDPDGSFVLQRILPPGDQNVAVSITGAGESTNIERAITIPRNDWFYVGVADLTFGRRFDGGKDALGGDFEETYSKGRLGFYANGKLQSGWEITASADTREGDLDDLLSDLDEKDPRSLLLRFDPDESYPVFGDDSRIEEDAPTSGKFYLKAEKDGNFALWGNYKAKLDGGTYLRNERTLYGAQGFYATPQTMPNGEARAEVTAYAAQPDNLPGREIFLGTGGSLYFLRRQDISIGSETVTVELRDRDTGRVVGREPLTYGRDYDINYTQGIVSLSSPLSGSTGGGLISSNPSGDVDVRLVVQYEFTPTITDVDGYTYGARAQVWATEKLRFGVTGMVENTDLADQTATGIDVLYQFSESTFVELDYARTEGPGFGFAFSNNGGVISNSTTAVGGDGEAFRLNAEADLRDLGAAVDGRVGFYAERRTEGFSTLDYQVDTDEELWGFFADVQTSEELSWRLYYDDFEDDDGKVVREGGGELNWQQTDRLGWTFAIEHTDKTTPTDPDDTGRRTDVAVKLTFTENEDFKWWVFGITTAERSGELSRNDRVGIGASLRFSDEITVEGEISDGSLGTAGRALVNYDDEDGTSTYFGYTLETERELSDVTLSGADRGRFVAGGRRKVNDDVTYYGENTYDLFGTYRSLTSTYGVDYDRSEYLSYSASYENGRVEGDEEDIDRHALTFGVSYEDELGLSARGRLELRRDRGEDNGTDQDLDAILLAATVRYKLDEERRLLFAVDSSFTESDGSSFLDGDFVDVTAGYAIRPIENDKLNLLFKYEYLYDMFGQRIDDSDERGPRQESHVISLDAEYDLNRYWTVGGKIGARLSQSAPSEDIDLASNNAWLAVANGRYHVTHKWDVLLEGRMLQAEQAETTEYGALAAVYRHVGNNAKIGLGYNFGRFSDDLTDLTFDDRGVFLNLVGKF